MDLLLLLLVMLCLPTFGGIVLGIAMFYAGVVRKEILLVIGGGITVVWSGIIMYGLVTTIVGLV